MSGSSHGTPPVLVVTGAHPQLYNHDLAPTSPEGRTWGAFSIFAMWMSDVHSVGGYTFAASLFFLASPAGRCWPQWSSGSPSSTF